LEENRGVTGYGFSAHHWDGNTWVSKLPWTQVNGFQGKLEALANGNGYHLLRHNDEDDMTVFDWDGNDWTRPYKNRNMVDNDDFDLFYESTWHANSGNDFFIAKHPRNVWEYIDECVLALPEMWGWYCVARVKIPYWQTTHRGVRLTQFERRDGEWSNTESTMLGYNETFKEVRSGQDWWSESKVADSAWFWNGLEWHSEKIGDDILDGAHSLGNNMFFKSKNDTTFLYR
jgi:hypothetical protein